MLPWSEARIPFCKRIPYRNNCVPADAPDHRCVRDAGIRAVADRVLDLQIVLYSGQVEARITLVLLMLDDYRLAFVVRTAAGQVFSFDQFLEFFIGHVLHLFLDCRWCPAHDHIRSEWSRSQVIFLTPTDVRNSFRGMALPYSSITTSSSVSLKPASAVSSRCQTTRVFVMVQRRTAGS